MEDEDEICMSCVSRFKSMLRCGLVRYSETRPLRKYNINPMLLSSINIQLQCIERNVAHRRGVNFKQ